MRDEHECRAGVLARSRYGRVEQCGCGVVRVTVGNITVHLKTTSFLGLAWTFQKAAEKLSPPPATRADRSWGDAEDALPVAARSTETH